MGCSIAGIPQNSSDTSNTTTPPDTDSGETIDENKEVVRIIVSAEQAELVFESMYMAAELDTPGKGIMYLSELDKIATYVPDNVLDTVGDK